MLLLKFDKTDTNVFSVLFRYSSAIFVSVQMIKEHCASHPESLPTGIWWRALILVRHFLAHAIYTNDNEILLNHIALNIRNL